MNLYIKNLLRFCIIIALQVLILNNITLYLFTEPAGSLFVPLVYPLFILLLPFETPVWVLLFLGFFMGCSIDAFMTTAGMHAAATLLIAYLRTNVLNALMPHNLNEYAGQQPSIKNMGWMPFLVYSGFLILLHHITFFLLESWTLVSLLSVLVKILTSFITSMSFILVYILLFTKQSSSRA